MAFMTNWWDSLKKHEVIEFGGIEANPDYLP